MLYVQSPEVLDSATYEIGYVVMYSTDGKVSGYDYSGQYIQPGTTELADLQLLAENNEPAFLSHVKVEGKDGNPLPVNVVAPSHGAAPPNVTFAILPGEVQSTLSILIQSKVSVGKFMFSVLHSDGSPALIYKTYDGLAGERRERAWDEFLNF